MAFNSLDTEDQSLMEAATDVLRKDCHPVKHTVDAAARCGSSRVYTGLSLEAYGYRPRVEPIAIGSALTNGERELTSIAAVCKHDHGHRVLSPCGN